MHWVNRWAKLALFFIFLVILAGAVVRTTGSGMGCPDWPKCFGYYIPPTEEAQVLWQSNHDYQKGQIIVRNEALWVAQSNFTSGKTYNADNWAVYTKHDYAIFNATHTWVEYINRLLGALSGLPVLALFIASLLAVKRDFWLSILAAGTLFLLGYEAWLGKLVVDGNLVPFAITKHMFGSLGIVLLLVAIIARTGSSLRKEVHPTFKILLILVLLLLASQIFLGTQVREQIDEIAAQQINRQLWVGMLDNRVLIHRSGSLLILVLSAWLFWRNWRNDYTVHSIGFALSLVILEVVVGAVLYYFSMPKFMQPIHLLLSSGTFALFAFALFKTAKAPD